MLVTFMVLQHVRKMLRRLDDDRATAGAPPQERL
jgi:hypothetical protein